jgi:hypothetical protein
MHRTPPAECFTRSSCLQVSAGRVGRLKTKWPAGGTTLNPAGRSFSEYRMYRPGRAGG